MRSIAFIIRNARQAEAVLHAAGKAGIVPAFVSAPEAAHAAGASFLAALERVAGVALVVDCGDAPGRLMACLRMGLRHFIFTGDEETRRRLEAMAAEVGGTVKDRLPSPCLELPPDLDTAPAMERWLAARLAEVDRA